MTKMQLEESLCALVNEYLDKLVPLKEGHNALLYQAARYSLLLPGKRLRPLLLLKVLEDYHIPIEKGLPVAAAIEMIHTYSLIHDDLPCMDDDDLRRGKPALHTVYGEGQALLAGDFLLTRAFEVLAKHCLPLELTQIIAQAAGGEGMIGGQTVDLSAAGQEIDWDSLLFMYLGKTAALFSAALECGAVLSNLPFAEQSTLRNGGKYFGIAYQIRDDILDTTSDEKTLGKPIFSDHKNKKANCLTLYGKKRAQELMTTFLEKAMDLLPAGALKTRELLVKSLAPL